jgi:hypothetical protein
LERIDGVGPLVRPEENARLILDYLLKHGFVRGQAQAAAQA